MTEAVDCSGGVAVARGMVRTAGSSKSSTTSQSKMAAMRLRVESDGVAPGERKVCMVVLLMSRRAATSLFVRFRASIARRMFSPIVFFFIIWFTLAAMRGNVKIGIVAGCDDVALLDNRLFVDNGMSFGEFAMSQFVI